MIVELNIEEKLRKVPKVALISPALNTKTNYKIEFKINMADELSLKLCLVG